VQQRVCWVSFFFFFLTSNEERAREKKLTFYILFFLQKITPPPKKPISGSVRYAYTTIPTYPSGQIGFMVCTKAKEGENKPRDPSVPARPPPSKTDAGGVERGPLRYYSEALHSAAFSLPAFAKAELGKEVAGR
jgi:hypothetical protein